MDDVIANKTKNITNPLVTLFINQYYEPLTDDLRALREECEEINIPLILKECETFFQTVLKIDPPKKVLEIGTAYGYSAMFFNELTGAEVYTIEKNPDMIAKAKEYISRFGYSDRIHIMEGDGEDCVNLLISEGHHDFDLVFIDAAKSQYKRFFTASMKALRTNGLIICDNILFHAKTVSDEYDKLGKHRTNIRNLREFNDFIMNDDRFDTTITSIGDGLSISRMK